MRKELVAAHNRFRGRDDTHSRVAIHSGWTLKQRLQVQDEDENLFYDELERIFNTMYEQLLAKQTKKVNRLEVIDETGRAYVKGRIYGTPVKIQLSYQDNNRTLKVFVNGDTNE